MKENTRCEEDLEDFMKQRIVSFFLTLVLLLGAFVIPTFATVDVFTDVPGYWAADDIYWAYENGIAAGVGQNTFAPRASLTRACLLPFCIVPQNW